MIAIIAMITSALAAAPTPAEFETCKKARTTEEADNCFGRLADRCAADPGCLAAVESGRHEVELNRLQARIVELEGQAVPQQDHPVSPSDVLSTVYTTSNHSACLEIYGFHGTGPDASTAYTFKVNGKWAHIDGGGRVRADLNRNGLVEDELVEVMNNGSAYFICDPYQRLEVELVQLDLNQAALLASNGTNRVYTRNTRGTQCFSHDPQTRPERMARWSAATACGR